MAERINALIAKLSDPGAADEKLTDTQKAIAELVGIGAPAVPFLVKAIVAGDPKGAGTPRGHGPAYSALALDEIGRPAVEPVRAAWQELGEVDRWKLMRFRGKHDSAAARPFALESLTSKSDPVVVQAVRYLGQHKEAAARTPLLGMLNTAPPAVRWDVLDALTRIGGEGVVEAIIRLLDKGSWAARGEGLTPPEGEAPPWWPDGRPRVIESLRTLKARASAPALLAVLREKGAGKAYLGPQIIPFLGEHGGAECLGELKLISETPVANIAPALVRPERIKALASEAIRRIAARHG